MPVKKSAKQKAPTAPLHDEQNSDHDGLDPQAISRAMKQSVWPEYVRLSQHVLMKDTQARTRMEEKRKLLAASFHQEMDRLRSQIKQRVESRAMEL
jgi:hypothetical protein